MNEGNSKKNRLSDDQVDRLVRRYLLCKENQVNPELILERVQKRLHEEQGLKVPSRPRTSLSFWVLRGALAASLLFALFWIFQFLPQQASAENIVREALQVVESTPADRSYLVEVLPGADPNAPLKFLPGPKAILWTRGDRYWVHSIKGSGKWAWGRDEKQRVWVAVQDQGFRFYPKEIPNRLQAAFDLRTLDLETLLRLAIKHYDLSREREATGSGNLEIITAELKKDSLRVGAVQKAILEVDPDTKIIQKVTLVRPFAKVTYTLQEMKNQRDRKYQLEGHLSPEGTNNIDESGHPGRRFRRMLKQLKSRNAGN